MTYEEAYKIAADAAIEAQLPDGVRPTNPSVAFSLKHKLPGFEVWQAYYTVKTGRRDVLETTHMLTQLLLKKDHIS